MAAVFRSGPLLGPVSVSRRIDRRFGCAGVPALAGMMMIATAGPAAALQSGPARDTLAATGERAARARPAGPLLSVLDAPFVVAQLEHPRVHAARVQARFAVKQKFHARGVRYPAEQLFLRVFKRERTLEVWVRPTGSSHFELLDRYAICALAGEIGPKRTQGDGQTPEGFYYIDTFNPASLYHLSLHVDYPNASDRALGRGPNLGGDIYIHGGCLTEGCIAVTDDAIKELYWLAVETRAAGQTAIPVHIFPARLNADEMALLRRNFAGESSLLEFWQSLVPGYDHFERTRQLPPIRVDAKGRYDLLGGSGGAAPGPAPH